jgi:hypothetical protein
MTDPVARDRPRTEAGKRLRADLVPVEQGLVITQRQLSDRILAIEDEAAGVSAVLAKVRAEIETLRREAMVYTTERAGFEHALDALLERLGASHD